MLLVLGFHLQTFTSHICFAFAVEHVCTCFTVCIFTKNNTQNPSFGVALFLVLYLVVYWQHTGMDRGSVVYAEGVGLDVTIFLNVRLVDSATILIIN